VLQPVTVHWGVPDPAAVQSMFGEIDRAFAQSAGLFNRRISSFRCLPLASFGPLRCNARLTTSESNRQEGEI